MLHDSPEAYGPLPEKSVKVVVCGAPTVGTLLSSLVYFHKNCVCVCVCVCDCLFLVFSLSCAVSFDSLSLSLSTHSSLHKLPLSLGVTRTLETLFVAASADDILGKTQLIHNFSKQDYRVGGDLPKRMEEQVAFVMDRSGKKVEISLWDASGELL